MGKFVAMKTNGFQTLCICHKLVETGCVFLHLRVDAFWVFFMKKENGRYKNTRVCLG